ALKQWAGRLSGIPVTIVTHRSQWNPLLRLFQRIKERINGADEYLVRWPPSGESVPLLTTKEFTNEFKSCLTAKLSEAKIVIEQPLHLKVAKPEGTTFYA